jgi:Tfp pilus assembly protein PilN
VRRPLNLARQPFRNERLPTLVLLLGCAVLLGLSVRHAVAARDLLPERTAGVDGELVALEQEVARLRTEAARLRTRSASEQALREWAVIRDLVDRRAFSWSELLGRLEEVVPAGIRLVSIAPTGTDGEVEVAVTAVGEAVEDGLEFLEALQKGEEFREPFLSSVAEASEGIGFSYTMIYVPAATASGEER